MLDVFHDRLTNKRGLSPSNRRESELTINFGKCFWFSKYKGIELDSPDFLLKLEKYFKEWPNNYLSELEVYEEKALKAQFKPFNKTAVNDIWKEQISLAKCSSPIRHKNSVVDVLTDYFVELVERYPTNENQHANIADSLLTQIEAATLMRTTAEQVYLLVEQGYLSIAVNIKSEQYLEPYLPVFYLRQVVELIQAQGSHCNDFNQLTTAW